MIEFENAGVSFGAVPILRELNLTLAPGSFHFLVGASGSGKSTLLRLCYLDLAPSSGRIRHFGRRIARGDRGAIAELRRAVGVVQQDSPFLDHLSLVDNIALPLQVSGIDMRDRGDDLRALLDWVDLADRMDALPPELSRGERQLAALARAVILSPEVILADEPTGNIDRDLALRLLTLLIELNRMGKAVVIATHDLELIRVARARVDAEVLRLVDGRVERVEVEPMEVAP